jgi:putative transposase
LGAKLKVSSNQVLKGKFLSQFAWQNGYAAFSVAESTLESVIEYVTKQDEHHQRLTFQEEYRAFLHRHHVNLDERYVWDLSIWGGIPAPLLGLPSWGETYPG